MNTRHRKPVNAVTTITALCIVASVFIVTATRAETREVVAGPQYDRSGWYKFWFGENYRKLWTTPIEVEVLDLQKEAGGLTVEFQVGGLQTPGLAMKGADGRAYTFRSVDKDLSEVLPVEWREKAIADRVQDSTAATHPGVFPVDNGLSEQLPWPATPPQRLVVMPDDPALGEYREVFAGRLGSFGEYPLPASDTNPGFMGATEILSTRDLWSRWLEDPSARVNTEVFLWYRIADIWMGNWDRHSRQWRWASIPGEERWWPIPEDPDGAFADYGGIFMSIARGMHPKLLRFKDKISGMEGVAFNGADIDRWVLIDQDREAFIAATREIQALVTDEVIDNAVRRLPPEWYEINGEALAERLKKRRDNLEEAIERYYRHLMSEVSVRGTNLDESLHIRRFDDGAVEVTLGVADPGTEPYYRRRFEPEDTNALRIYLYEGDDQVVSEGPAVDKIKVYVVGGPGDDSLDDSASGRTRFHDFEGQNEVTEGKGTRVDARPYEHPAPDPINPWLEPRDHGVWTRPSTLVYWTPDLGLLLGAGAMRTSWKFRKFPYASHQSLMASYSTKRTRGALDYGGDFRRQNSDWAFGLRLRADGLEKLNFFGFGNQTARVEELDDQNFYRVRQTLLGLKPNLNWTKPSNDLRVAFGFNLQQTDETSSNTLIAETQPYGSGKFDQLGLFASLEWKSLGLVVPGAAMVDFGMPAPGTEQAEPEPERRTGWAADVEASYFPATLDVIEGFGTLDAEISGTLGLGASERVVIGARLGGRKVFGDVFPWFESAFVGGFASNRGLKPQRFAGDRSLYGSLELRVHLFDAGYLLPGRYWLVGFGDAGRVWFDGDDSSVDEDAEEWHPSYGVGLTVEFAGTPMKLTADLAKNSVEDELRFYVGTGFTF